MTSKQCRIKSVKAYLMSKFESVDCETCIVQEEEGLIESVCRDCNVAMRRPQWSISNKLAEEITHEIIEESYRFFNDAILEDICERIKSIKVGTEKDSGNEDVTKDLIPYCGHNYHVFKEPYSDCQCGKGILNSLFLTTTGNDVRHFKYTGLNNMSPVCVGSDHIFHEPYIKCQCGKERKDGMVSQFESNGTSGSLMCGDNYHIYINNNHFCQCGKKQRDSQPQIDYPTLKPVQKTDGLSGWVCPICGAGNSPFNDTCPCRRKVNTVIWG